MKEMIKILPILALFVIVISCATAPGSLSEKYNLDDYLESVDQINALKISSWESVDNQSVIIKANWNDYYLLVLRRPLPSIIPGLTIGISSEVSGISSITPGYDRIYVKEPAGVEYYVIEKIYKLKGKEQVKEIKERLGKNQ